jgi:Domain of Unknown Function (DUF1206)
MRSLRAEDVRLTARSAVSRPENRAWIRVLARVGLVAKGISYGIVGILALELAFGRGGEATSRTGALATLAQGGSGKALLVALAVGFGAYALWRLAQAFFEVDDDESAKKWAKRAGYLGRAAIYAGLTYSAIKVLSGAREESQSGKAHKATAHVLSWPAGTWLVGIAGACIVGAGLWNGYRALTQNFSEKWNKSKMSELELRWGTRVGVAGMLARGVVFALIGIFVVKAALDYDPNEAIGLDGALQKLAGQTYGDWLLGLTAAGFLAYALYCFVDARYRRV